MIGKLFEYFIGALSVSVCSFYASYRYFSPEIKVNLKKHTIIILLYSLYLMLMYFSEDSFIRIIGNYCLLTMFNCIIFKEKIYRSYIVSFIVMILFLLAESIFSFFVLKIFMINMEVFRENYFITMISNISITSIIYIFVKNDCVTNKINKVINYFEYFNINRLCLILLISIISLSSFLYGIYFGFSSVMFLILNIVVIINYIFVIIEMVFEKKEVLMFEKKYNDIKNNLETNQMLLKKEIYSNHENNNNLISIRGLIQNDKNDAIDYINSLIVDKRKNNDIKISNINKLKIYSLRELIMNKYMKMEEKSIETVVNIDKSLESFDYNKIDIELNKNICTIVGIFLDNAMQEVENNEKQKMIGIYIYLEKQKLIIVISNNFRTNKDFNKIEDDGFSTK